MELVTALSLTFASIILAAVCSERLIKFTGVKRKLHVRELNWSLDSTYNSETEQAVLTGVRHRLIVYNSSFTPIYYRVNKIVSCFPSDNMVQSKPEVGLIMPGEHKTLDGPLCSYEKLVVTDGAVIEGRVTYSIGYGKRSDRLSYKTEGAFKVQLSREGTSIVDTAERQGSWE